MSNTQCSICGTTDRAHLNSNYADPSDTPTYEVLCWHCFGPSVMKTNHLPFPFVCLGLVSMYVYGHGRGDDGL